MELGYNDLTVGSVFYTATGKWVVTEVLPDGKWMARMIWKRKMSNVPIHWKEPIEFDCCDLGGCSLSDRFANE